MLTEPPAPQFASNLTCKYRAKTQYCEVADIINYSQISTRLASKRFPRMGINGTHQSWQVNAAGRIYRNDRLEDVSLENRRGMPSIDFGKLYNSAGQCIGPGYYGPLYPLGRQRNSVRLLDEVVCLAFHGPPPGRFFRTASVIHLDGDMVNCHADNLRWQQRRDQDFTEAVRISDVRKLMWPDHLPNRPFCEPAPETRRSVAWVEAMNIVGWVPVQPIDEPRPPNEKAA
jgi:hypothetical protein